MITVIGAGNGQLDSLTLKAFEAIKRASKIFIGTKKMMLSRYLEQENIPYRSMDEIFDESDDFDELNARIKAILEQEKDCVYIVYGNALDDTSVQALSRDKVTILPGISAAAQACAAWSAPGNIKTYTATEILSGDIAFPHADLVISCIDSPMIAGELKCKLSEFFGDEYTVKFYCEDFDNRQMQADIPLYELDRQEFYNHTACIYLSDRQLMQVFRYDCDHLAQITKKLCGRKGCPWDSAQTHESLRPYLIEEAYEVAETINAGDPYRLFDELGDVLFQVMIHAAIGEKSGEFNFYDVTDAICRKMIARHPNVFGNEQTQGDLLNAWEEQKKQEKGLRSTYEVMLDVPDILPSLAYAEKIQYKAEKAGQPMQVDPEKLIEKIQHTAGASEEDWGDILFDAVALCRANGVHPELALHRKITEFIKKWDK